MPNFFRAHPGAHILALFILVVVTVLTATTARAEKFRCEWSEPRFRIVYDSQTQVLETWTVVSSETNRNVTTVEVVPSFERGVQMRPAPFQVFEIVDSKGKLLYRLTLNGEGRDGVSELVYPFHVIAVNHENLPKRSLKEPVGGCFSKTFPPMDNSRITPTRLRKST
jgi:hypothetical protein